MSELLTEPEAVAPPPHRWLAWERKVWGWTAPVVETVRFSLHFLHGEAGGYCSIHRHRERTNRFYIRSGAIIVRTWGPHSEVILEAGEALDVAAGILHQFEVLETASLWEAYLPARPGATVSADDIERLVEGGVR